MARSATIRARIEPALKKDVEKIFERAGLNTTQVITALYKQVKRSRTIPFKLKIPNAITLKTIRDTDKGKNLVKSKTVEEMFKKLGL